MRHRRTIIQSARRLALAIVPVEEIPNWGRWRYGTARVTVPGFSETAQKSAHTDTVWSTTRRSTRRRDPSGIPWPSTAMLCTPLAPAPPRPLRLSPRRSPLRADSSADRPVARAGTHERTGLRAAVRAPHAELQAARVAAAPRGASASRPRAAPNRRTGAAVRVRARVRRGHGTRRPAPVAPLCRRRAAHRRSETTGGDRRVACELCVGWAGGNGRMGISPWTDVAVPPRDVRAEGCSFLMRAGTETSGILAPSSCRPATATVVPLATLRRPRCKIPSNEAGMRACDVLRAMLSGLLHCTIRFLTQVAHLSLRRRRLCDCDRPRVLCTCDVLLFHSSASCVLSLANFLRGGCECTSYLCISSPVLFCVVCPHGICPGLRQGGREYGYAPQQGGMEYGYAPQQGYGRGPPEEAQRCFAMCTRGYANYSIHTHIYPGMCFRAWTWVFRTCSMSSTTRDGERTCMHFAPTGRCSSPRTALRAAIMLR